MHGSFIDQISIDLLLGVQGVQTIFPTIIIVIVVVVVGTAGYI